jgi:hypothetical protein
MQLRVRTTATETEKATQFIIQTWHPNDGSQKDVFVWLPKSQIQDYKEAGSNIDPQGKLEGVVEIPDWLGNKKVAEIAKKMHALPSNFIIQGF